MTTNEQDPEDEKPEMSYGAAEWAMKQWIEASHRADEADAALNRKADELGIEAFEHGIHIDVAAQASREKRIFPINPPEELP